MQWPFAMPALAVSAAFAAPSTSRAELWFRGAPPACGGRAGTLQARQHPRAGRRATAAAAAATDRRPSQAAAVQPTSLPEAAAVVRGSVYSVGAAATTGSSWAEYAGAITAAAAVLLVAGPALALEIRMEPANALSLPTWAVHTSSVLEWVTAMGLM